MGLRLLWMFYSPSAGTDLRRHNLTSTGVRFWRLKTLPALKGSTAVDISRDFYQDLQPRCFHRKTPDFLTQCWFNIGPMSQRQIDIGHLTGYYLSWITTDWLPFYIIYVREVILISLYNEMYGSNKGIIVVRLLVLPKGTLFEFESQLRQYLLSSQFTQFKIKLPAQMRVL